MQQMQNKHIRSKQGTWAEYYTVRAGRQSQVSFVLRQHWSPWRQEGAVYYYFFLPESNNMQQEMRSINRADLVCVSATKAI